MHSAAAAAAAALGLSAQTVSILLRHNCIFIRHPQLIPSPMPTSPSVAEVRDGTRLKGGLSQQRSCWHGNHCLCEWSPLLCAQEVSHCLMVQEGPVSCLQTHSAAVCLGFLAIIARVFLQILSIS